MIISTIKHKGNYLGMAHSNHKYIFGFPRMTDAYDVQQSLPKGATIYLKAIDKKNIANQVKASMLELNMPIFDVADEIGMDSDAQIVFPKRPDLADVTDTEYTLHDVDFYTFMYLPYKNDLGLIIPYKKLHEDDTSFIYKANVVDSFWRKS
jgi:hypothetical protein